MVEYKRGMHPFARSDVFALNVADDMCMCLREHHTNVLSSLQSSDRSMGEPANTYMIKRLRS